jgi:hypothetical protein
VKTGSNVIGPRWIVEKFHTEYVLDLSTRHSDTTRVRVEEWDQLSSLSIHLLGFKVLPVMLTQALSSATFLEFDLATDTYRETAVYEALFSLHREIIRFQEIDKTEALSIVFGYSPKRRPRGTRYVDLETLRLLLFLGLMDRWVNIVELSASVLGYLDGGTFIPLNLRPSSPVRGMQEEISKETATETDVDAFVKALVGVPEPLI